MRYRLRTLMILMGVGPPSIAALWWTRSHTAAPEGISRALLRMAGVYAVLVVLLAAYALHNRRIYDMAEAAETENQRRDSGDISS